MKNLDNNGNSVLHYAAGTTKEILNHLTAKNITLEASSCNPKEGHINSEIGGGKTIHAIIEFSSKAAYKTFLCNFEPKNYQGQMNICFQESILAGIRKSYQTHVGNKDVQWTCSSWLFLGLRMKKFILLMAFSERFIILIGLLIHKIGVLQTYEKTTSYYSLLTELKKSLRKA
uniref:Uncharacterized protein n=1 Tax=Glossina brevipalpis TaxID=37001 RepID=A0A1A9W3T6_9MUSC